MKTKILISIVLLLFVSEVYSQFKINADGSAQFKVNNVLSGFTGNATQENVSFGYASLLNQSAGICNTAIGSKALSSNASIGSYNIAIGSSSLYFNTSGSRNTATGVCALYVNTTGSYNTADGFNSLISNTTGEYNSAVGYSTLQGNTTGSYNTAIGYHAGGYNPDNLTNSTCIGSESNATASNQVRIGNSNINSIGGYVSWSNISDGRTKKNIKADVPGLAFINNLQPVTYNLDLDAIDGLLKIDRTKRIGEEELSQELKDINKKAREAKEKQTQTGFIAQDVEKTAKSIGYDFSGVDVDEAGIYGLRYAEFVVPLVKAVQELSKQNDLLQQQINELQKKDALRSAESVTGLQELNSGASLQQNFPNPFSQTTQIKCYLPQSIKTAFLNIYNLQGKQLKQIAITQRGESSLLIAGSEFEPGIYLYALLPTGGKWM
jgi:hypothetical protein